MDIKIQDFESSHDDFSMVLKTYKVLREGFKVTDEEIDDLIKYHSIRESYEICDKLNKYKLINKK